MVLKNMQDISISRYSLLPNVLSVTLVVFSLSSLSNQPEYTKPWCPVTGRHKYKLYTKLLIIKYGKLFSTCQNVVYRQ